MTTWTGEQYIFQPNDLHVAESLEFDTHATTYVGVYQEHTIPSAFRRVVYVRHHKLGEIDDTAGIRHCILQDTKSCVKFPTGGVDMAVHHGSTIARRLC